MGHTLFRSDAVASAPDTWGWRVSKYCLWGNQLRANARHPRALGHALSLPPPPIHKTNNFLRHTQCSQPPLHALGQAPSVLTNPLPPAPSTASHDDEIVSLAAYDAESRAEMQKEQERRRSDDSVCSDAALLFLHRWLIGQHVWTASQMSSHRAGRTNRKLSFNPVPWARAPGTVPHPGRGGLSPPPCLGGQGWVPLRYLCTGGGITRLRARSWWHLAHVGLKPFLQACPQGTLSPTA